MDFSSGGDESILTWICMYYAHNPAHNVVTESDTIGNKMSFQRNRVIGNALDSQSRCTYS